MMAAFRTTLPARFTTSRGDSAASFDATCLVADFCFINVLNTGVFFFDLDAVWCKGGCGVFLFLVLFFLEADERVPPPFEPPALLTDVGVLPFANEAGVFPFLPADEAGVFPVFGTVLVAVAAHPAFLPPEVEVRGVRFL